MDAKYLAEIKEREQAAMQGPWHASASDHKNKPTQLFFWNCGARMEG